LGTIPAFASRTQENQENLCQDGRSIEGNFVLFLFSIYLLIFPSITSEVMGVQMFRVGLLVLSYWFYYEVSDKGTASIFNVTEVVSGDC
jgi:hypothetical protein